MLLSHVVAEEMGVGKTIEILALILANKAPAKGPGDTAPGQLLPEENEGTAAAAGVAGDEEGTGVWGWHCLVAGAV